MKFLAVTSCPTGVAHTYLAAEALEKEANARGIKIKIETQGSIGVENEITPADLAGTNFVILTKDVPIKNRDRFNGIPTANVNISDVITSPGVLFDKILEALAKRKS